MAISYYDAAILFARMGVIARNARWLLDDCALTSDERMHAKIIVDAFARMDDYMKAHLRPVTADEVDDDEVDDDDDPSMGGDDDDEVDDDDDPSMGGDDDDEVEEAARIWLDPAWPAGGEPC